MLRVALTGGIATGKTYVLEQFRKRGVPCLDADALAHGATLPDTEVTRAIAARFGAEILTSDGEVDRSQLGSIVFADPTARRDLEAIVHPAVYRAIAAGLRAFEIVGGHEMAVVDVPLLYETGHEGDFDRVMATVCTMPLQLERLMARGMSDEDVRRRLAAQWPGEEKARRADFVIRTDGTFDETDSQVEQIYRRLRVL